MGGVADNVARQQRSCHFGTRKFDPELVRLSEKLLHFVAGNNAVASLALGNLVQQLQLSFFESTSLLTGGLSAEHTKNVLYVIRGLSKVKVSPCASTCTCT